MSISAIMNQQFQQDILSQISADQDKQVKANKEIDPENNPDNS